MPFVPFPEWKPDLGALNSGALVTASGVLPLASGYGPWPSFVGYSQPLPATPQGGTISRSFVSAQRDVWVGTANKLYKLNRVTLTWDNVSGTVEDDPIFDGFVAVTYETDPIVYGESDGTDYNLAPDERWNFIGFGSKLIAHHVNDPVQVIDVDVGTAFEPLAGDPPQARYGAVVKDFVILANMDGLPNRLHWSGINNIEQWTPLTGQSDMQDLPEGGPITAIIGGETAFVFQEAAIRRMTYVGPPIIFQIDKILDKRGCKAPFSIVRAGQTAFYLSTEGFASIGIDGSNQLIDLGTWSEFFDSDVAEAYRARTRGVNDPLRSRIYWLYSSVNSPGLYDTILCWDYGIGKASFTRVTCTEAVQAATAGYSLDAEGAALDDLRFSLDFPAQTGEVPQFAAFNPSFELGFFSGSAQEATLETADFELSPGRRSFVSGIRPIVDNASAFVSLGMKINPASSKTYTVEAAQHSGTGICPFRSDARYHSVKLRVPAGQIWSRISGFDPMMRPTGGR